MNNIHSAQCTDVNTKSLLKKSFTIRAAFVETHQIHHVLQLQFISPVVECCFVGLLRCFLRLPMNCWVFYVLNIHNSNKIVIRFGRDNLACHIILENECCIQCDVRHFFWLWNSCRTKSNWYTSEIIIYLHIIRGFPLRSVKNDKKVL